RPGPGGVRRRVGGGGARRSSRCASASRHAVAVATDSYQVHAHSRRPDQRENQLQRDDSAVHEPIGADRESQNDREAGEHTYAGDRPGNAESNELQARQRDPAADEQRPQPTHPPDLGGHQEWTVREVEPSAPDARQHVVVGSDRHRQSRRESERRQNDGADAQQPRDEAVTIENDADRNRWYEHSEHRYVPWRLADQ